MLGSAVVWDRVSWRQMGQAVALVALVGGACVARRESGRQCVFNGDCAEGLICAGHYCRVPCTSDRDCPAQGVCRSAGERDLRGCFEPSAPQLCVYASDCPAELVCTVDGTCGPECTTQRDCELREGRMSCNLATGRCEAPDGGAVTDAGAASDASADGAGS